MSETALASPGRKGTADYRAAVAEMLADIGRLNKHMRQDQADIDRLKAEAETLKEQTHGLRAETRAILARLGAAL